MNDIQVLELQLENSAMKIEILNLRQQLAQAVMPAVQKEREDLIAQYKTAQEASDKGKVVNLVQPEAPKAE